MSTLKRSFIVDISTATPRHWTPYRGLTSDGRKGLIVDAIYYRCLNVRIPEIQGSVAAAPPKITLVFGHPPNSARPPSVACAQSAARRPPPQPPFPPPRGDRKLESGRAAFAANV